MKYLLCTVLFYFFEGKKGKLVNFKEGKDECCKTVIYVVDSYWLGVPPGCILSSKQYTLLSLPTLPQVCGQVINPSHCYRKYLTFQKGSSACTEMSFHVQSKTENLPFFETDFSSSPSAALLQSFGGFRCSYVTDAIAKLYSVHVT